MGVDSVVARLERNEETALRRLVDWLKMPSISTDPAYRAETRQAAEWARDQLREIGIEAELRETGTSSAPGHPIVWAHHAGGRGGPHVLFYGHYDVQPPDPLELWESPPFEPTIKGEGEGGRPARIVARGAVDDKGQVHTFLEALRAWTEETDGDIPLTISVLLEGEEESGSANLEQYLNDHADELKQADFCLISDTGMLGANAPAVTYGVRGLAYTEVILHAADQDLHSGLWGGRAPNPISELVKVLSQLWNEKRRVTIPGFYDNVRELSAEERRVWSKLDVDQEKALAGIGLGLDADVGEEGYTATEREWARPTCDINGVYGGYQGAGAKTVIPSHAGAKVSFRLVADQDTEAITESFRKWIMERTPPGCRWEFHDHSGGPPATVSTDSPYLAAARRALKATWGVEAALIKSGGSIPVVGMLKEVLGLETLLMGFGLEDDRVHSPNEKFDLSCWRRAQEAHARLIGELAAMAQ